MEMPPEVAGADQYTEACALPGKAVTAVSVAIDDYFARERASVGKAAESRN